MDAKEQATTLTSNDVLTCPLCNGEGTLTRAEVLDRVGAKDFKQIAAFTAEEMLNRTLKHSELEERRNREWYQTELARQLEAERTKFRVQVEQGGLERQKLQAQNAALVEQVKTAAGAAAEQARLAIEAEKANELAGLHAILKDHENKLAIAERERDVARRESAQLAVDEVRKHYEDRLNGLTQELLTLKAGLEIAGRQKQLEVNEAHHQQADALQREQARVQELGTRLQESERALQDLKTRFERVSATKGRAEEIDFETEARTWPEIELSEKLKRDGDYQLWLRIRDANGNLLRAANSFLIDNKDDRLSQKYVDDIVRAAQKRTASMAILVFKEDHQLRPEDRIGRWSRQDGIWVLRTTRVWLRRDLEVLRPIIERLAQEGPEFLDKESSLIPEITKTLRDLDEVDEQLKKARKSLDSIEDLCKVHRSRLAAICSKTDPPAGT